MNKTKLLHHGNTPEILLVGKRLAGSLGVRSFFEDSSGRLHFTETLRGAARLLRLRHIDVVVSPAELPDGRAYSFLENRLASSASLILSFPVESTYLWVPAIWNGEECWGTSMLPPAELREKPRDLFGRATQRITTRQRQYCHDIVTEAQR